MRSYLEFTYKTDDGAAVRKLELQVGAIICLSFIIWLGNCQGSPVEPRGLIITVEKHWFSP